MYLLTEFIMILQVMKVKPMWMIPMTMMSITLMPMMVMSIIMMPMMVMMLMVTMMMLAVSMLVPTRFLLLSSSASKALRSSSSLCLKVTRRVLVLLPRQCHEERQTNTQTD